MKQYLKISTYLVGFCLLSGCYSGNTGQEKGQSLVYLSGRDAPEQIIKRAAHVVPSTRQLEWQKLEYTAFVHFGLYTFLDNMDRHTPDSKKITLTPDSFHPENLDCRQWVSVFKKAGMKGIIFTAKHHDGFCLWPSQYTDFSVKNSKWRNGKGDVVRELSDACKEYGLKLGIYLSPWDRHNPYYGTPEYNEYFKNQLKELLTNYGDIFEIWFDGACFEGPNGKKQDYDWKGYVDLIRGLQPNTVIAIMGPDIRWVGTESGYGRDTEWSVVPVAEQDLDKIAAGSQREEIKGGAFIPARDMIGEDIGGRNKILKTNALAWYPSEVDVSIRPSWGYLSTEDTLVKTPEKLMDIYYSSVGKNSLLLLNVPPDSRGLINEADIKALMAFKGVRDETFKTNLLEGSEIKATENRSGFNASKMLNGNTYWTTPEGVTNAVIEFDMKTDKTFDRLLVQENIENGQRVETFIFEAWENGHWVKICNGTTIGYKRILRFPVTTSSNVRLRITGSRDCPEIKYVGLYKSPDRLWLKAQGFLGQMD